MRRRSANSATVQSLPEFSAVLLAGGRSTRMGRDKALLGVADALLWQRQHAVLVQAGAVEVFVSAREEQTWAVGPNVVRDSFPDCGPLGGIVAAADRATCSHLAVLAVDLPLIEASWFSGLLAESGANSGVVARQSGSGGFFEPLAAIYPHGFFGMAREALINEDFSMQRLVRAAVARGLLSVHVLSAPESGLFMNWNTLTE